MGVANIVYTHSDYFDVLEVFLEQQKTFGIDNITIFSDKNFNKTHKHIIYDSDLSYTEKLKSCLEQLDEEFVLYQHEDMFLYSKPNFKKIAEYLNILQKDNFDFVRLSRTGNCILTQSDSSFCLWEIDPESEDFFAVQPSIWKRESLIKFLEESGNSTIWDLELNSGKINSSIRGLLHYDAEPPRGGHFDSFVWPYVATAIVKGKWNFKEYALELGDIDKVKQSKRGQFL
jgi:hypothetical protein|tara:strand:- start:327 stop:1016 length:690 start_codon:yes stop_codon:yes gene_type:complete